MLGQFIYLYIFWSFTLCLVGVKIEMMENIGRKIGWKTVFFTVWQRRENGEEGKPGRKFSLPGPQFSSSQIGRKIWRGKCCESTFTEIPSPNVHNNPARQNKKEAKNNHQTQHHTKHRKLAQKTKTYHNQNRNSKPNQKIWNTKTIFLINLMKSEQ